MNPVKFWKYHNSSYAWSKRLNVYFFTAGCAISTVPHVDTEGMQRVPSRDVPRSLWEAVFPNCLRKRLAEPSIEYRGIIYGPQAGASYLLKRQDVRGWSLLIQDWLKAMGEGQVYDQAVDMLEYLRQRAPHRPYLKGFIGALNAAAEKHGYACPIELCDCGHAECTTNTTSDHVGDSYCESCAEDLVGVNGDLYPRDDVYYWESDDEYHLGEEPDDDDDDDDANVDSCDDIRTWGASTEDLCHDRSFDSSPMGDFIMGVELEVESTIQGLYEAAEETLGHFSLYDRNCDAYVMLKSDGSLSDQGFEIVTAARKLTYHLDAFKSWQPHSSLTSWNPGTCGLHVHIDSRAFSALTLGKFLMLINDSRNKDLIKSIAGRHPLESRGAHRYCAQMDQDALATPSKALGQEQSSRYRMTNLTNLSYTESKRLAVSVLRDCKGNYSTVELRIFRGSLKKERLLAQIEFAHASVMFCRTASWSKLNEQAFKVWLATMAGSYKNLAHFYGINVPKENKKSPEKVVQLDETN